MQDYTQAVDKDVGERTRTANTKTFIETFFPLPKQEHLDAIFAHLSDTGTGESTPAYDPLNERWTAIPKFKPRSPDKLIQEEDLVRVVNAIQDAVCVTCPADDTSNATDGVWMDVKAVSQDVDIVHLGVENVAVRPELVFVPRALVDDMKALDAEIFDTAQPLVEHGTRQSRALRTKRQRETFASTLDEKEDLWVDLSTHWWRQVHVPFVIQSHSWGRLKPHLRLFNNLQQVLTTQLDRRFAFGLWLNEFDLTICLYDRSGVVTTANPIDIHKDPKAFIQVIAGISMLTPEKLGWDPAMNVYIPDTRMITQSFRLGPKDPNKRGRGTYWVIDLPSQDGSPADQVVTVRALAMPINEVICGRATIVWEVVLLKDLPRPSELYVLKRWWRPTTTQSHYNEGGEHHEDGSSLIGPEIEFYKTLGLTDERIHYHGDILVDGAVDSTLNSIRRGLSTKGFAREYLMGLWERGWPKYSRPVDHIHSQFVMKDPGIKIIYFSSLAELVRVIRDCVQEHDDFRAKGVLHRDISTGNLIVVVPLHKDGNNQDQPTKGRVIDFDFSKRTTKTKRITLTAPDSDGPNNEAMEAVSSAINSKSVRLRAGKSIISTAWNAFEERYRTEVVHHYVERTILMREHYFGLTASENGTYSCADLGWDKKDMDVPDFNNEVVRTNLCCGTLPCMSYEVMAGKKHESFYDYRGEDSYDEDLSFFHDSAHDLDSFIWVILDICLSRTGPGMKMYKVDLFPNSTNNSPEAIKLRSVYSRFFEADQRELTEEREELLTRPEIMDDEIIPCFDPYFEPLKEMVLQLWHTLVLAYHFRAFEYHHIHAFFLDILDKTLEKYKMDDAFNGIGNPDTERELQRRKDYYNSALSVFDNVAGEVSTTSTTPAAIEDSAAVTSNQKAISRVSATLVPVSPPRKKARLE